MPRKYNKKLDAIKAPTPKNALDLDVRLNVDVEFGEPKPKKHWVKILAEIAAQIFFVVLGLTIVRTWPQSSLAMFSAIVFIFIAIGLDIQVGKRN